MFTNRKGLFPIVCQHFEFGFMNEIIYLCEKFLTRVIRMRFLMKISFAAMFFFFCPEIMARSDKEIKCLYHTLDSLIYCQDILISEKKAKIEAIHDGVKGMKLTSEQELALNNRLYDEYMAFNFDSAHQYIKKNIEILKSLDDANLKASSFIRMAHILAVSGLFEKADAMLGEISLPQLNTEKKVEYYNQKAELFLYRSEMAQHSPYFKECIDSTQYYRQLILQIAPKESFEYITNFASYTCERGDEDQAIRIFENYLPSIQQGDRRYSIITSTLAYFYSRKQLSELQEKYLLLCAISDLRGTILENNSFRELSSILMERGDYTKAYSYLSQASDDAQLYGSRLRSVQVAHLSPLITKAYDAERAQAQHRTNIFLIIISLIALLLVGSVIYTLSLMRKRRLANEKISKMNVELSQHNDEIRMMNVQMKEANRIKDEYIGRFLELCSNLIYRSEERLKKMNRLARERKLEELYAELKSNTSINGGIRMFHQNFDTAFLNIYPDFVSEVNRLMTDGNGFDVGEDANKLTTELRVLALIRLGIQDNQKIADILRSSITTVYTYRSKLKSKARNKDSFEDDIRRIATY